LFKILTTALSTLPLTVKIDMDASGNMLKIRFEILGANLLPR